MSKELLGPSGIIDPPWNYNKSSSHQKLTGYSTDHEYPALTTEELAQLPVNKLMRYVALWTTGPFVEDAYKLIRAWGFIPITQMYWVKCTQVEMTDSAPYPDLSFKPNYGVGYWFRGCVEPIIFAKAPDAPSVRTPWVGLLCDSARHSRKPDSLHQLFEKDFPGPYIELFGRRPMPGWTVLGNDAPGDGLDIRASIQKILDSSPNGTYLDSMAPRQMEDSNGIKLRDNDAEEGLGLTGGS